MPFGKRAGSGLGMVFKVFCVLCFVCSFFGGGEV